MMSSEEKYQQALRSRVGPSELAPKPHYCLACDCVDSLGRASHLSALHRPDDIPSQRSVFEDMWVRGYVCRYCREPWVAPWEEKCRRDIACLGSKFLHLRDLAGGDKLIHATLWSGRPSIHAAWTYCQTFGMLGAYGPAFQTKESRHDEVMRIQRLPVNCPRCRWELRQIAEGERLLTPQSPTIDWSEGNV